MENILSEIKTAINPNGDTITFREDEHSYTDNKGLKYTSVTTLIHGLFPEFKEEEVAQKVAIKRNKSVKEILDEWKYERDIAGVFGTQCHLFAEMYLKGEKLPSPSNEKEELYFSNIKNFIDTKLAKFTLIEAEKIIFSPQHGISGTIDLLMRNSKGDVCLLDWKTNKAIKRNNPFQKGLTFLNHLDDCNYIHYSLQLNIYKTLLTKEKYFDVDRNDIITALFFINPEGVEIIQVHSLDNETDAILSKCQGR